MKKGRKFRRFVSKWSILIVIVVVISLTIEGATLLIKRSFNVEDPVSSYRCDVKHFLKIKTTIDVYSDENLDGVITGDFAFGLFKKVHDPLVYTGTDGNVIAKGSDEYHIITQDDHTIVDGSGNVLAVMKGQFKVLGEKYSIYDAKGEYIGYLDIGVTDTYGGYYNTDGELCASYKSHFLFKDYDVVIGSNSDLSDEAVLMLFASYHSDHAADSTSSGSSHSNRK